MEAATFTAWLDRMKADRGWSSRESARRLGCSKDSPAKWMREGAPTYIGLACAALARELGPWTPGEITHDVAAALDQLNRACDARAGAITPAMYRAMLEASPAPDAWEQLLGEVDAARMAAAVALSEINYDRAAATPPAQAA